MSKAQEWSSRQSVWAVVSPNLAVELYATRREAERAQATSDQTVHEMRVWREGFHPEPHDTPTPYDEPRKLWERVVIPAARFAYQQGFAEGRSDAERSSAMEFLASVDAELARDLGESA